MTLSFNITSRLKRHMYFPFVWKKAICRSSFLKRQEMLFPNHIRTHANLVPGPHPSNDVRLWKSTQCSCQSSHWFISTLSVCQSPQHNNFFLRVPNYSHIYLSLWRRGDKELLFDQLTFRGNGAVLLLTYFWAFPHLPEYLFSWVNSSKMWHKGAIYTFPGSCFARKLFPLRGSLFRKFHVLHSIYLPSLGLLSKVQHLSMQLHIHILATVYSFLASLRESWKPEEQIQMFLSLASSVQNSRWQEFIWKCIRLTQHLLLLTITFLWPKILEVASFAEQKDHYTRAAWEVAPHHLREILDLLEEACRGG